MIDRLLGFDPTTPNEDQSVYTDGQTLQIVGNTLSISSGASVCLLEQTAGENLFAGEVVRVNGSNQVIKAKADSDTTSELPLYVVFEDATIGNNVTVQSSGCVKTLLLESGESFQPNSALYLSPNEAGRLTHVEPTTSGNFSIFMGYSDNNGDFDFNISEKYLIL